jgi:hypothetical protein
MLIEVIRSVYTDDGTFGTLSLDGVPFAVTLENPWINNQPFVSCIPAGTYRAKRCRSSAEYDYRDSPKYGNTFVIENVENRSKILFHWGNLEKHTQGCILVGSYFGQLGSEPAVLNSRRAFNIMMKKLKNVESFTCMIRDRSSFHQEMDHDIF